MKLEINNGGMVEKMATRNQLSFPHKEAMVRQAIHEQKQL